MRIFLAGASGVIGLRLVPLLLAEGHAVAGMTRSPSKVGLLAASGAEPVLCDVYDSVALQAAVVAHRPEILIHELTDLPDEAAEVAAHTEANARIRIEGTRNLLDAAAAAGVERFLAQSIAWRPGGRGGEARESLEELVLAAGGVVLRYGRFYGPGTYSPDAPPEPPRIHLDEAARRTVAVLGARSGVLTIAEGAPADG